jgi:DNA-directed RNA polymerase subunit alpha
MDGELQIEMDLRRGRGYVPSEENAIEIEGVIGKIPVDSIYSPVLRVRYSIEQTRVGKLTNYDRLIVELWTDGTISPEMALVESAKIYRKHLNPFVLQSDLKDDVLLTDDPVNSEYNQVNRQVSDLEIALDRSLLELELSVRARNCLDGANLQTIRDLVSLSEQEVMNLKNLGKTSLTEIKSKLTERGLALGMAAE